MCAFLQSSNFVSIFGLAESIFLAHKLYYIHMNIVMFV